MPVPSHVAVLDPALSAVVVRQSPLLYTEGADASLDRPAHVRAGSGLARIGGEIAVVQDDANLIALVDPVSHAARAIHLPAGKAGRRLFDDELGNKRHKLDLEACFTAVIDGESVLVALGSGSKHRREQVVLVRHIDRAEPTVTVAHVPEFYAALRAHPDLAGDTLNLEGVTIDGDVLQLFARGNGKVTERFDPAAALCSVSWTKLLAHLHAPATSSAPEPYDVRRYALGSVGGTRLGFTDAARWSGNTLYTATAEDSVDAVLDGPVAGSVIGLIDGDGHARYTSFVDERGAPFAGKVEGVLAPESASRMAIVVIDADDWRLPSMLCEVELRGPWLATA